MEHAVHQKVGETLIEPLVDQVDHSPVHRVDIGKAPGAIRHGKPPASLVADVHPLGNAVKDS